MKNQTTFPINKVPDIQHHPHNFRLISRLEPMTGRLIPRVGDEKPVVFLDTETTGTEHNTDAIVEIGFVRGTYSPSKGCLASIDGRASIFNDPGRPIPEEATRVHGIKDEDVAGERITQNDLDAWLFGDPLVIAHKSEFDRPFVDALFPNREPLLWACSLEDVDWRQLGYEARALSYLCIMNGVFYEGHRAVVDCEALAFLMATEKEAFQQILARALKPHLRVEAKGAPYEVKDTLFRNRYTWNREARVWWKDVPEAKVSEEKEFLDSLYHRGGDRSTVSPLDPRQRFVKKALVRS